MEQIIPKKDRGRLIHDSDYIEPENGRLVVKGSPVFTTPPKPRQNTVM